MVCKQDEGWTSLLGSGEGDKEKKMSCKPLKENSLEAFSHSKKVNKQTKFGKKFTARYPFPKKINRPSLTSSRGILLFKKIRGHKRRSFHIFKFKNEIQWKEKKIVKIHSTTFTHTHDIFRDSRVPRLDETNKSFCDRLLQTDN